MVKIFYKKKFVSLAFDTLFFLLGIICTKLSLRQARHFHGGLQYWGSHAGTNIWSDWKSEIV